MGNSFVAAMAKGRVLLVALLLSLTLAGVLAVRRTDDDDDYDHHEAPADYEAAEASTSTGDYEAPKQTNTGEAAEDPNAPPRPSFLTGMAPVMAVMLASKMVPALDAGGSSIPMLISVMIYPRAIAYVEQNYGSDFNFHEDENMFTALNCAAALAVFAVVVNVGKAMGHFGPAGQDVIGQPAGPLSALEMCARRTCRCDACRQREGCRVLGNPLPTMQNCNSTPEQAVEGAHKRVWCREDPVHWSEQGRGGRTCQDLHHWHEWRNGVPNRHRQF